MITTSTNGLLCYIYMGGSLWLPVFTYQGLVKNSLFVTYQNLGANILCTQKQLPSQKCPELFTKNKPYT